MENNNIGRVRLATEDDVSEIVSIERKCFTDPWSENAFRAAFNENTDIFVLDADGLLGGFAVFDRTLVTEAEIHIIAVDPDMRGKGFSKLLMDAMVGSADKNGVERIMLEVRASNEVAISLYTKYGFEKVGLRPGYYRNPVESAILMDLQVKPGR